MKIWSITAEAPCAENPWTEIRMGTRKDDTPRKVRVLVAASDQFQAVELARARLVPVGDDWTMEVEQLIAAAPGIRAGVLGENTGDSGKL